MALARRRAWWLPPLVAAGLLAFAASVPAAAAGSPASAAVHGPATPGNADPADDALNGVDCLSSTDCVAVGHTGGEALAQVWNGSTWTATPGQTVDGNLTTLNSVSCSSSSGCLAVGEIVTGSETELPQVVSWDGSTWQAAPAPDLTGDLSGISCTIGGGCMVVGSNDDTSAVSAFWNGSSWTTLSVPVPAGNQYLVALTGVSCADATDCTAVGYTEASEHAPYQPFAEQWTGGAWQLRSVPLDDGGYLLSGVSCPSASDCIAVGGPEPVQWNGSSWQLMSPPSPGYLQSISCSSDTSCAAFGRTGEGPPTDTVGAQWNGTAWTSFRMQDGSNHDDPLAVSCVSAANCMVTGLYNLGSAASQQLALAAWYTGTDTWDVPAVPPGYQVVLQSGAVDAFHTDMYGSQGDGSDGTVVGIAPDAQTGGYWVLYANGYIAGFNAPNYGSEGGSGATPVGIAADPATGGYWILNSNGGVNNYGAPWYGSERSHLTSKPVGITSGSPSHPGYWIVNVNGGVANYNEPWSGSEKGHVTGSVVGIASDQQTAGYWILNSVGGVTGFGAPWRGSEAGHLAHPVVAIAGGDPAGGYWILNSAGGVSGFDATGYGSLTGTQLSSPPVGLTAP